MKTNIAGVFQVAAATLTVTTLTLPLTLTTAARAQQVTAPHHVPDDPEADAVWDALIRKAQENVRQGKIQMQNKNYDAAITSFQEAVKSKMFGDTELAEAYTAKGDDESAMRVYADFIQRGGNSRISDADVRMNYALLLHRAGKYTEALRQYQLGLLSVGDHTMSNVPLSITVNEQNMASVQLPVAAHLAIAVFLNGSGGGEAVVQQCDEAIRLKPGFGLSYLFLGKALEWAPLETRKKHMTIRAALEKAADLGIGPVKQQAEEALKPYRDGLK